LVLNAGCPLELDALPVGGCTRTVLDKAEIILMKLDSERYRLEVVRFFAEFVWNFLSSAGWEFDAESS
jgi:sarcosine oxidase subunit gamma